MSSIKRMFALIIDVATAPNGGVRMALFFHILVTWIRLCGLTAPAIHVGLTVWMPLPDHSLWDVITY
ncbi:hypothetical protein [Methylicorpusculum sp.]|uniref:hypothetical protein n=1 Tax=Methylicorpusculum sp. TaxID=2713644 RepID=UPI00271747E5|nr:hypothetical protein [Methylicorpusculum sp.]MDO8842857.1 hypothetical protein [Methylicorpusculum sp.]